MATSCWHAPLQVAESLGDIANAVLQLCLRGLGMPGNALAKVLDVSQQAPHVAPASLMQAISYSREYFFAG